MFIRRRPREDRYYYGYLLEDSDKVQSGTWHDIEGCTHARVTIVGMGQGDKVAIWVSNMVSMPKQGQGIMLAKPYTKDLEAKLSYYKWVKAEHVEAGLGSVTVHFWGWN